jgi:hypothetical protein
LINVDENTYKVPFGILEVPVEVEIDRFIEVEKII